MDKKRSKRTWRFLAIFSLLMTCSIGVTPATTHAQNRKVEKHFGFPFSRLWGAIIEGLVKVGDHISYIDKENGLIIVEKEATNVDEYALHKIVRDCPCDVQWEEVKLKLTLFAKPVSDAMTQVIINASLTAKGIPYEWKEVLVKGKKQYRKVPTAITPKKYVLTSNGLVEQSYMKLIEKVIKGEM